MALPRKLHTYELPVPGKPIPGWTPPPEPADWRDPPADWDEATDGPFDPASVPAWAPAPDLYAGPDPWDGAEPLFTSFAIRGLTAAEEIAAAKAASDAPAHGRLTTEMAILSLAATDGVPIDEMRGSFDRRKLWAGCPPKVRDLWTYAYRRHNEVEPSLVAAFLASYRADA